MGIVYAKQITAFYFSLVFGTCFCEGSACSVSQTSGFPSTHYMPFRLIQNLSSTQFQAHPPTSLISNDTTRQTSKHYQRLQKHQIATASTQTYCKYLWLIELEPVPEKMQLWNRPAYCLLATDGHSPPLCWLPRVTMCLRAQRRVIR